MRDAYALSMRHSFVLAFLLLGCGSTVTDEHGSSAMAMNVQVWSSNGATNLRVDGCGIVGTPTPPAGVDPTQYVTFDGTNIDLLLEPSEGYVVAANGSYARSDPFLACSSPRAQGSYGSSAYFDIKQSAPALDLRRAYTLTFDAELVDAPAGAMAHAFIEHQYQYTPDAAGSGAIPLRAWVKSADRIYVDATKRSFRISINPYLESAAYPDAAANSMLNQGIYIDRFREAGGGTLRFSNWKLFEGLSETSAAKTAFDGERVAVDRDGNFSVFDPALGQKKPLFPISLSIGTGDVEFIGKRRVLAGLYPAPAGVVDVANDTVNSIYYRGIGYDYLRASGFNTIKGWRTQLDRIAEAHGHGIYSLVSFTDLVRFSTPDGLVSTPPVVPDMTPAALQRGQTSYPIGLLAWWNDWEDHAMRTDFAAWDQFVNNIDVAETSIAGRRMHPILTNSGVPGRYVALEGRADVLGSYHPFAGSGVERALQAQPIPFAMSVHTLMHSSTAEEVTQRTARMWDAIATGSKMIHWFSYATSTINGALCGERTFANYEALCSHADDTANALQWDAFANMNASIQGSLDFIRAPIAAWSPSLNPEYQRRANAVGKNVNNQRYVLITNATALDADVPIHFGLHVLKLSPVVTGDLSRDDTSLSVLRPISIAGSQDITVSIPAFSARFYRIDAADQCVGTHSSWSSVATGPAGQDIDVRLASASEGRLSFENTTGRDLKVKITADGPLLDELGKASFTQDNQGRAILVIRAREVLKVASPCATQIDLEGANLLVRDAQGRRSSGSRVRIRHL